MYDTDGKEEHAGDFTSGYFMGAMRLCKMLEQGLKTEYTLGSNGITSCLQVVEHGPLVGRHPLCESRPVNGLQCSSSPSHVWECVS